MKFNTFTSYWRKKIVWQQFRKGTLKTQWNVEAIEVKSEAVFYRFELLIFLNMVKTIIDSYTTGDDLNMKYSKHYAGSNCEDKCDFKYFEVDWRTEEPRKDWVGRLHNHKMVFGFSFHHKVRFNKTAYFRETKQSCNDGVGEDNKSTVLNPVSLLPFILKMTLCSRFSIISL